MAVSLLYGFGEGRLCREQALSRGPLSHLSLKRSSLAEVCHRGKIVEAFIFETHVLCNSVALWREPMLGFVVGGSLMVSGLGSVRGGLFHPMLCLASLLGFCWSCFWKDGFRVIVDGGLGYWPILPRQGQHSTLF